MDSRPVVDDAVGAEEWVTDPDYATAEARSRNRDRLNVEINKRTETKSSAYWIDVLNAAGVRCGPTYSIDQVFGDEQVKHLGMAQDVPNAGRRNLQLVAQPTKLSRMPSVMAARPPEFGEHSDEILVEFGFGEDEIAELKQQKVV